jgi:hypothetical protein
MSEDQATTRYASRKFLLALLVAIACIVMRSLDLLDQPQFVDLLKWTLGLYFGANVVQKAAEWTTTALAGKKGGSE